MKFQKQKLTVVIIIFAIFICSIAYSILSREKVEISNTNWKIVNGNYSITFSIQNKTQIPLETKLSVRLRSKKFAGGSPKAELSDLVGEKQLTIFLNPSEIREMREIIKPTSFTFKADTITIKIWSTQQVDLDLIL